MPNWVSRYLPLYSDKKYPLNFYDAKRNRTHVARIQGPGCGTNVGYVPLLKERVSCQCTVPRMNALGLLFNRPLANLGH